MALRKRSLLPIGIHLNLDAVHIVQMEQVDGSVSLVSSASKDLRPEGSVLAEADGSRRSVREIPEEVREVQHRRVREFIRAECSGNGFRGKQAVISMPTEDLVIQHVRMAPMQPEELVAALPWELQGKLPFDPKQAVIRHIVAGAISEDNQTKQDVIVLAVARAAVEKQVTAVEKLGLDVVGVGVEPCAMSYPYVFAAERAGPRPDGPASLMLVYVGTLATHAAIVRGEETRFVKGIPLGLKDVAGALAKELKVGYDEALNTMTSWRDEATISAEAVAAYNRLQSYLTHFVEEVESCMRYYASLARGAKVDRIAFLGSGARHRALVQVLGAHLSVPGEVGHPMGVVGLEGAGGPTEPELAVAAGLSLFGAQ